MCFKPKCLSNIQCTYSRFHINGSKLELVSIQIYLGVIIDDTFKDKNDLYRQTKAIYAKGNVIVKKFSKCNADIKAKLFKTYFPAFYCRALWYYFDTMSFKKLKGSFNRMFHKNFNIPHDCSISQTLLEYKIDNIIVLLQKSIYRFRCRLLVSDYLLVQAIVKSNLFYHCSLTIQWNTLLIRL